MRLGGHLHFDFSFDKFLASLQYLASRRSLSTLEVLKALYNVSKMFPFACHFGPF